MFRRYLFMGILTAIIASICAVGYASFYNSMFFNFSAVVGNISIVAACFVASILICIGAHFVTKAMPKRGEFLFNVLLTILTFVSIFMVLSFDIPPAILAQIMAMNDGLEGLEVFFPIYVIPMHFFPAMIWFSLRPLFFKPQRQGI